MGEWTFERLMGGAHRHSEAEVVAWVKQLRYFCFMGEVSSGQMELYEELQMRLRFNGRDDLIQVLTQLGLLRYGVGEPPKFMTVGRESRVSDHPDLVAPGHCSIAGIKCFVSVNDGFIDVTCFADWHVSQANVDDALRIETLIDTLSWQDRVDRSIAKHTNCVSAENFPDRFARRS